MVTCIIYLSMKMWESRTGSSLEPVPDSLQIPLKWINSSYQCLNVFLKVMHHEVKVKKRISHIGGMLALKKQLIMLYIDFRGVTFAPKR